MNNRSREIVEGFLVCTVTFIDARRGFGYARNMGKEVRFDADHGYKVKAGKRHPEFTSDYAVFSEVKEGTAIVAYVTEGRTCLHAMQWCLYPWYKAMLERIELRPKKPAPERPAIPTVEVASEATLPLKFRNGGIEARMRRTLRVRILQRPNAAPMPAIDEPISLEKAIEGRYVADPADPVVEGQIGSSSCAPAPQEETVRQMS